jgi:hypothetical protein
MKEPQKDQIVNLFEQHIKSNQMEALGGESQEHKKRSQSAKSSKTNKLIKSPTKAKVVYIPCLYVK